VFDQKISEQKVDRIAAVVTLKFEYVQHFIL